MHNFNSNYDYFGWGWILWFGFIFLVFSSFGNWGYAYRAHRKFDGLPRKDAASILNERYAAGELTRAQYLELKSDIAAK
ncbi:SHOCT domain-containing protein (plasmid) [Sphingomonas paeninsulae]|uniref:SHOCT domain-containing protein n=1 Tax=Sphingomonas paeninsulae TaxID=2319844 RepID=A0A494T5B1_SPHPE|nr:SHOCT domain-containing protein [Sphingomonas paeninsulae]AYJ84567.1 SHOCT domain-containing protein [Sphingomonas paeninsulae]